MNKILSLFAILFTVFVSAQVPQGVSYQAIAVNDSGNPVVSSNVGVRLSILDNSATGSVLYTETHVRTTNPQGLFNLVIGQGTPTVGTFVTINWALNSKFLKVEMDVAGGINYVLVGTTQLLSVPYALYAGNTASISGSDINAEVLARKNSAFAFASSTGNVYAFHIQTGTWIGQSGTPISGTSIYGDNSHGSFAFASNDGSVYAFNSGTGAWIGQTGGIISGTQIVGSNGNFAFASTNGNIYAFNKSTASWVAQSGGIISGTGIAYTKDGSFAFASTDGSIYAFNSVNGTWVGQAGGIISGQSISASNGNFAFPSSNGSIYVFRKSSGTWIGQSGGLITGSTIKISETN